MKKNMYLLMSSVVICFILGACNLPWESEASEQIILSPEKDVEIVLVEDIQTTQADSPEGNRPAKAFAPSDPVSTTPPAKPVKETEPCDRAEFIADVTVPDGTTFSAGDTFTKTWKLKNIGSCTWTNAYVLAFEGGDKLGGPNVQPLTGAVAQGQGVNISVDLTAPSSGGPYRGYWQLRNNDGEVIPIVNGYQGHSFYVDIRVSPTGQGSNQQATFSVTSVTFSVSHTGFCGRGITYEIQADITTNGAGKVDYQWIHSETGDHELPKLLMFNAAGTQTVTTEYKPGSTPPFSGMWMDLYINDPNNQQFGRANLDCSIN
jgi:hypothetical protein